VNESYLNYTNVSIINSTGSIINSSVNSTNSTATFYLNIYTDGNYSINATAFDLAGNSNRSVVSNITIDSQPPICVLVNRTPSKINDTSNGTFNVILNCSDYSGINTTLTGDHFWGFTSRTLDSFQVAVGVPNRWSIRPTPNNISQVGTNLTAYGPIFRAQGRGRSFWYESLSGSMAGSNLSSWFLYDNYSYAADDGHYGYFNLTLTNSTHAIINFTSPSVELSVFRQNIPLSYDSLVSESKKNFLITKNAGLLVQRNDLEAMKGSANYTIIVFRNIALQSSPIAALRAWYCNSTYSPTGGVTVIASPNCVLINTIPASAVIAGNIVLTDRNSSYYKGIYSISNNSIGGIVATPIHYYYYDTLENSPSKGYDFRYANGTTITNTSFAQTNRTWTTANDGASFTALAGTADLMEFTTKSTDDEFQFGYCIYDSYNHLGCNSTVFADQISPTNHPISVPAVIEYNSSGAVNNTNLSGYQMGTMNILIGCSKDPDSVGNVTHNLTLFTAAGAYNYTINSSFKCTNDSNTWINFNTSLVQDGLYKTNVSATSGDNPLDIQSFLTAQNFTIDNTAPAVSIVSPLNSTFTNLTLIDFSYTVTESNLNWTNVSIYNSTGDIINTTTNSSNGTVHSYLSVYTDGYYIFNVTACDLAGTCTQARGNFTRDATLPSVTINSPVSNSIVYSRMIDVNLSVTEAHLNLTNCTILNSTGSLLNSTTNSSNGSAQCYMTIYQDGNINISAIAYDLAGNMYSANVSNITVDTSLVIINFTLNSPSSGSFINSTTTVLNVTYYNTLAKDGNITFNISPGLSPNSSWCYQETANISTLCGGSALGNYSSSGFNSLGREAWDENWSSAASLNTSGFIGGTSGQIIINYSKPYGASNESLWQVKTSNGTANRTLPDSCWNAYLHVLSVRIDSKYNWDIGGSYINSSCYNGTSWVILDSLSTGFAEGLIYEEAMYWNTSLILWNVPSHGEASLLTTNLSSGQYTWSVLGTDSNSTNTSAIWNFTIDLTAPQVSISLPISNFATNLSPISISGNATDINLNYTNISLINSSGSIRNSTINTTNGTFTATLSAYSNGVYSINATAFDLAGNSNRSTVANITIDTVSPTISILSPLNNTWTNQTLIVFNYTVSDSYLNQTNVSVYNSSGALVNSSVNSSNGNAYAYISIYADGAYTFNVTACDTAGNCNQSRGNFTRDVTAPQVIINSPTTGENLDSRYVVINLTVNDLRLNYTNISLINSSGGIVNSTTSALTGNYEVTMLVPFNMILSINATSYDVAGNINQSTVTGVNASISVISTVLISPLNDSISNPLSVVLNLSYYNFDFLTGNASFYSVPIKDCYQESANVSNQSGMDGSCGLLYTGDYAIDGSWSNTSALYDGNWSTSGYSTDAGGFVYMYSNYTIPSLAVGAVLQGNVGAGNYNYTIPQACLEWSSKLTIISRSSNSSNTVRFSCATGPASSSGLVTISGTDQLNEEAIYWKVALGESDSLTYGDYANVTWPGLLTNTTYYWYVNITDGLNSYTSPTWQFTTDNAPSSPVVSLNLLAPMVNDTLTASGNSTDYEASNLTYYYRFYDETNSSFLTAWTTDPNLTLSDSGFAGHNITAYSIADDGVLNSSSGNASIIILNLSITLPVSGSNVFTHNINSSFNMTTGGNLSCTEMYNLTMYPRGNLTNGTHNYSTSVDFGNHTYTIFCISEQNSSRNFSRSAVGIVNSFGIWNVSLFNENNWTVPFNTSKVDNGVELIVICSSGSQYFYPNVSAVTTNLAIFCDVEWVEAKLEYNSSSYFRSVPAAGYGPFADIHLYLADAYIYTVLTVPIRILNSDYYNANITLYKEDIDPITSTSITYIITAGTFDVARIFPSYLLKDNRYLINITRGTETRDIGFLQPYTNGEQDLDIQEITLAPTQSVFSNAVQFGGSVNNSTGALIVTYQDSTQKTENITIVIYNNTGVYHNQTYVNSSNITLTMSGVDVNQSWYATYSLYHESYLPGQAIEGGTSLSAPLIFAITLPSYLYPLIAFLILFLEAAVITPKSITGGILFVGATLAMLFSASWIPVGVETMALSFMILAAGLILNMRNKGEAI
jgi:hypothetical protein